MRSTSARAILGSRYSSMYFIGFLDRGYCGRDVLFLAESGIVGLEHSDPLQKFVGSMRFFLVQTADGEADVDQNVVAGLGFRYEIEEYRALGAAELHDTHAALADFLRIQEFPWNSQTHKAPPT